MAELSKPLTGTGLRRSRVIGLWKDAKSSGPIEIELDPGCEAALITLSSEKGEEWTADGRRDNGRAVYPTLSAVRCISRPKTSEKLDSA
jgi:hypothetical protein